MKNHKGSIEELKEFKNLVISPHVDDEVLGCSSILGKDTFVYFCGLDESKVNSNHPVHRPSLEKRISELKNVSKFMGFEWSLNLNTKVNHYEERELIPCFEEIINKIKPEKIFIPFPGYNQDHRVVYEASHVALRPHDKNHFVKKILVYEQEQAILWEDKPVRVNYFIPLDIEKKIHAYSLHESQVRSMRSFDFLEAIAKIRGKQSNNNFSEAFIIERWID